MSPASNSEARKRAETGTPTVLVEIPVDLAWDFVDTDPDADMRPAIQVGLRVRDALVARITGDGS